MENYGKKSEECQVEEVEEKDGEGERVGLVGLAMAWQKKEEEEEEG